MSVATCSTSGSPSSSSKVIVTSCSTMPTTLIDHGRRVDHGHLEGGVDAVEVRVRGEVRRQVLQPEVRSGRDRRGRDGRRREDDARAGGADAVRCPDEHATTHCSRGGESAEDRRRDQEAAARGVGGPVLGERGARRLPATQPRDQAAEDHEGDQQADHGGDVGRGVRAGAERDGDQPHHGDQSEDRGARALAAQLGHPAQGGQGDHPEPDDEEQDRLVRGAERVLAEVHQRGGQHADDHGPDGGHGRAGR